MSRLRAAARVACLLAPALVSAQENPPGFVHYMLDDGLSNNVVTCVCEDRFGVIWIGTEDGLDRFDGYAFTVYKHDQAVPGSLANNVVTAMCRDSAGTLWVGTGVALDRYDPGSDSFIHYDHDSDSTFSIPGLIHRLCADRTGAIWIAPDSGGVVRYEPRTGRRVLYRHAKGASGGLPGDSVSALFAGPDGRVWIACRSSGIVVYDSARDAFSGAVASPYTVGAEPPIVTSLCGDREACIWCSTFGRGIFRFDPRSGSCTPFRTNPRDPRALADDFITTTTVDARGRLWVGTFSHGIELRADSGGGFIHLPHDPYDAESVSSPRVYFLYGDRRGSMWAGTWQGGVSVYHPWRRKFLRYRHRQGDPSSLGSDTVWALCEDAKGRLWVGTEHGGLNLALQGGEGFRAFTHDPSRKGSIAGDFVIAVRDDPRGGLWAAVYGEGVDRYDESLGTFTHFRHDARDPGSLTSNRPNTMCIDRRGRLWVGMAEGVLDELDPGARAFRHYPVREPGEQVPAENDVQSIVDSPGGGLWVGTFGGGLYAFDPASGAFHSMKNRGIASPAILSLALEGDTTLWVGTFADGLLRYDIARDSVRRFTERAGLSNNYIKGIVPDGRGNLWLSSNKGLTLLNVAAGEARNFDVTDGAQAGEFRTGAYWRGGSGRIYFGGVKGFNVIRPGEIPANPVPPAVLLTEFLVFDAPLRLAQPLADVAEIRLSHAQNFFSVGFVALDYTAPAKNRYAYRLEGFDGKWIMCGARHAASYTNLGGGTYVLRVRGANNDGVWSPVGAALTIVVSPPFWETWPFRVLLAALIAGIPFLMYRARFRRLLAVERTRSQIARDLHDELSATLSGINFFTLAILRDAENSVSDGSRRFLSLIHESAASLQESVSDIIWTVNPGHDRWEDVVATFRRYASDLFDSRGIAYRFDLPAKTPRGSMGMDRRRNLWLLYKEIVTNVARHSRCAHATVALNFVAEGEGILEIRDDGAGFDEAVATRGNGLSNIRSRAGALGGSAEVQSAPGAGTIWRIRFPL